jgi:hypothetical protein
MKISKGQVFEGLPVETARELMRAYRHPQTLDIAAGFLNMGDKAARKSLLLFQKAGYLEDGEMPPIETWVTTIKGNALANASFLSFKRTTAEKQLQGIIERAQTYNADPTKVRTVTQLIVFGSYLNSEQETLGDLDVAYNIVHRFQDDEFDKKEKEFHANSDRRFSSFFEQLSWPDTELHLYLKNRSSMISLTGEDITRFTYRYQRVYDVESDPNAVKVTAPKAMSTSDLT